MGNPWSGMGIEFEVRGARVVAIVTSGGGAIVEERLDLSFEEGRVAAFDSRGEDEDGVSSLSYHGGFYLLGKSPGDTSEFMEADMVIEGTHSNGRRLEIRGRGHIGYNEHGGLEGIFDEPPVMLIDDADDEHEDTLEEPKQEPEVRAAWRRDIKPKPSEQYVRAMYGRSSDWDD